MKLHNAWAAVKSPVAVTWGCDAPNVTGDELVAEPMPVTEGMAVEEAELFRLLATPKKERKKQYLKNLFSLSL